MQIHNYNGCYFKLKGDNVLMGVLVVVMKKTNFLHQDLSDVCIGHLRRDR